MTSLNVASPDCAEAFFAGRDPRCVNLHHAGSLGELRSVLNGRLEEAVAPATLDLIGHSTREHHLLRLGDTPIDMLDPHVHRFFRELAASDLLGRLRLTAVRLLGCETAVTDSGLRTLRMLAHTLKLPVFGTLVPLLKSHSAAGGFNPAFVHLLIEASPATWRRAATPVAPTVQPVQHRPDLAPADQQTGQAGAQGRGAQRRIIVG